VLDELGIQMGEKFNELPTANDPLSVSSKEPKPIAQAAGVSDIDADLQARLENLRRE
jgi:hypothetical protein